MKPKNHARIRVILGVMAILCFYFSPELKAEKTFQILIVTSSNDEVYRETINGFKGQISASLKTKISELNIMQRPTWDNNVVEQLSPDVVFTLGIESLNWASQKSVQIPIVATMVLKEDTFKKAGNITGVSLSYSMQTQIHWLKKFFPQQSSVAILYNPAENAGTVKAAKEISQQEGLKLVAIPVETPKELPYALEQLSSNVELLLAIPDETVMSVNTAKEVLLASFRNKVPLIGLSDNWVKSGAFYALSWDYTDLGKQSALLAQKILNGASVSTVLPEHPRKVAYTVNAKIAEHMNIDVSNSALKNAKVVF
ncbi:MAG: hypothetical protein IPN42_07300 [Methylococcaceae bacterium]|nr:hypothetical protein [Methylococcaceae bacterium]